MFRQCLGSLLWTNDFCTRQVETWLSNRGTSFRPSFVRWGVIPFGIAVALFFLASAVSLHSIYLSLVLGSRPMTILGLSSEATLSIVVWGTIACAVIGGGFLLVSGMFAVHFLRTQNTQDDAQETRHFVEKNMPSMAASVGEVKTASGELLTKTDTMIGLLRDIRNHLEAQNERSKP